MPKYMLVSSDASVAIHSGAPGSLLPINGNPGELIFYSPVDPSFFGWDESGLLDLGWEWP